MGLLGAEKRGGLLGTIGDGGDVSGWYDPLRTPVTSGGWPAGQGYVSFDLPYLGGTAGGFPYEMLANAVGMNRLMSIVGPRQRHFRVRHTRPGAPIPSGAGVTPVSSTVHQRRA